VETLLKEGCGRCPSLIHEPIKHGPRKARPDVFSSYPAILLKEGAKVCVSEPEDSKVCLIRKTVFGEAHAVEILRVEPIHLSMRIPRITRSPIHLVPVNRPEIGDNIQIVLRDVATTIFIEEPRHKLGFHY